MAPNPRRRYAEIRKLYEQIPPIRCRLRCQTACGPIDMSIAERTMIEREHGKVGSEKRDPVAPEAVRSSGDDWLVCNKLNPITGNCSIYDMRPMICRLWGVVESMPCPWGCVPEGGHLSDEEGFSLLAKAARLGGAPPERAFLENLDEETLSRIFASADARKAIREYVMETGREYRESGG